MEKEIKDRLIFFLLMAVAAIIGYIMKVYEFPVAFAVMTILLVSVATYFGWKKK